MSPLGAVVTYTVRIINDYFEAQKQRDERWTECRHRLGQRAAVPVRRSVAEILRGTSQPEKKHLTKRILMSKADVSDAFRNVRTDPDEAHNFCYTVEELVAIDFRLTFGWSGSPVFWGVMSAASEHAH